MIKLLHRARNQKRRLEFLSEKGMEFSNGRWMYVADRRLARYTKLLELHSKGQVESLQDFEGVLANQYIILVSIKETFDDNTFWTRLTDECRFELNEALDDLRIIVRTISEYVLFCRGLELSIHPHLGESKSSEAS
jgi:hypothetical protein